MRLVTVISSAIKSSVQFVKTRGKGKEDVQETKTFSPYGIDSAPIENMIGLYIKTESSGENMLVGYINKNAIARPGELRLFSTDADGVEKTYMHFKANGTIDLNGSTDYAVRFNKLEAGFNQLLADHNALLNSVNTFWYAYIPGGPALVGSPPSALGLVLSPSTASISLAKINKIRVSGSD